MRISDWSSDVCSSDLSADGRRRTVASEEGGEYRVTDVPAGPVNLKISYTGYIDETASIKIVAGQTVRHDAALILSTRADQDAEIVVTAGVLEGDARAIMDQRQIGRAHV